MATKKYDAVATIGKYTDRNGDEKKRYLTVGAVFENDEGHLSMKLEAVPVGTEWSGWLSFYIPKEREASPPKEDAKANAYQPQPGFDDGIPF